MEAALATQDPRMQPSPPEPGLHADNVPGSSVCTAAPRDWRRRQRLRRITILSNPLRASWCGLLTWLYGQSRALVTSPQACLKPTCSMVYGFCQPSSHAPSSRGSFVFSPLVQVKATWQLRQSSPSSQILANQSAAHDPSGQ